MTCTAAPVEKKKKQKRKRKRRYVDCTDCVRFMMSLKWVDMTYIEKHERENPQNLREMYYPNMVQYSTKHVSSRSKRSTKGPLLAFVRRYSRRVGMWLGIYALSLLPVVGRFVIPAASFYTVRKSIGTAPAAVIFGSGIILPKRYITLFLHTYFASRSLMRELVSLPLK